MAVTVYGTYAYLFSRELFFLLASNVSHKIEEFPRLAQSPRLQKLTKFASHHLQSKNIDQLYKNPFNTQKGGFMVRSWQNWSWL